VGETATRVATAKIALALAEAFFRGVLCNALVCLALWLTMAAHAVSCKILAILFPITAFFAIGCEHANMFFIPLGMLTSVDPAAAGLTMAGLVANLIPATLGNIVGGSVFVPLVRYIIYGHDVRSKDAG
jgi:formate/nitrite transporter FocA (FNT family)